MKIAFGMTSIPDLGIIDFMQKNVLSLLLVTLLVATVFAADAPQGMVFVPAGEFIMGSAPEEIQAAVEQCKSAGLDCTTEMFANERPQRQVYLDAFFIDEREVSIDRFVEFLNANGNTCGDGPCLLKPRDRLFPKQEKSAWIAAKDEAGMPVADVTWEGANAYCKWAGKRLPTEAEWEKAARGTDGRDFPWGDIWNPKRANFCDRHCPHEWADYVSKNPKIDDSPDDGQRDSAPTNLYSEGKSPYGVLNMAGNIWEWCADWYDPKTYEKDRNKNPKGPKNGEAHVLRGGGWASPAFELRSAARFKGGHGNSTGLRGFRCAMDAN